MVKTGIQTGEEREKVQADVDTQATIQAGNQSL